MYDVGALGKFNGGYLHWYNGEPQYNIEPLRANLCR